MSGERPQVGRQPKERGFSEVVHHKTYSEALTSRVMERVRECDRKRGVVAIFDAPKADPLVRRLVMDGRPVNTRLFCRQYSCLEHRSQVQNTGESQHSKGLPLLKALSVSPL